MKNKINPRYVNYARVNGNDPETQMKLDQENYKGGCMTGFILFISTHGAEFKKQFPQHTIGGYISCHASFDKFLDELPIKLK